MRTPPWLQSLIPRLQSLQSLLSRSLSRLLPPCAHAGRTPDARTSPEAKRSATRKQKQGQASEDGAGRRGRPSTGSRARAASKGSPSRACPSEGSARGFAAPGRAR